MIQFNNIDDLKTLVKNLKHSNTPTLFYTATPTNEGEIQIQMNIVPFESKPVIVDMREFTLLDNGLADVRDMSNSISHVFMQIMLDN